MSYPWSSATSRACTPRVLTVTDLGLDFPHVAQAVKIHRYRTDIKSGTTRQTVYAITDMTSRQASPQASPQRLGQLARSHRGIESVHHVRDTTFAQDASKVRTRHGPANMATLRNLAVNTLRDAGHHSIVAGLRQISYAPFTHPLDLLTLARPAPTHDHQNFESALSLAQHRVQLLNYRKQPPAFVAHLFPGTRSSCGVPGSRVPVRAGGHVR